MPTQATGMLVARGKPQRDRQPTVRKSYSKPLDTSDGDLQIPLPPLEGCLVSTGGSFEKHLGRDRGELGRQHTVAKLRIGVRKELCPVRHELYDDGNDQKSKPRPTWILLMIFLWHRVFP